MAAAVSPASVRMFIVIALPAASAAPLVRVSSSLVGLIGTKLSGAPEEKYPSRSATICTVPDEALAMSATSFVSGTITRLGTVSPGKKLGFEASGLGSPPGD